MSIGRRPLLAGLGAAAGAALLAGCRPIEDRLTRVALPKQTPLPRETGPHAPAVRALNRLAFGPRPGDVARVQKIGLAAYVDEQLNPDAIDEEPAATWRVRRLNDSLGGDPSLQFDQDDNRLVGALREATLLRAVYSRRQLHERMTEFWTDHFNIYAHKGQAPQLKAIDDRDTIRKHALGKFRDLLGASAKSGAMLGYLDNTVNKKGVPNENYARELMELHTLGVDGGYTQRDVREVARCLTGWTVQKHWHRGAFLFDKDAHDDGRKIVLGAMIPPGGGASDGERVLDLCAAHPATARHIARKLCVYFLGHAPDATVAHLATIFRDTGGDIKAVLRPLLTSDALVTGPPILKRPFDFVASSLRALNADTDGGAALQRHLERMGQPLFGWPRPDGFPTKERAWTGALVHRWNYALALGGNGVGGTKVDWKALEKSVAGRTPHDGLLETVFGRPAASTALSTLRAIQSEHAALPEYAAVLILSPEFQWR